MKKFAPLLGLPFLLAACGPSPDEVARLEKRVADLESAVKPILIERALAKARLFSVSDDDRGKVAAIQIADIDKALDLFKLDVGRYPTNLEGLQALMTAPPTASGWNGPYLKDGLPSDPWGNPFRYANPGPNGGVQILSLGADNAPGGTGGNADIVNQQ